MNMRDNPDYVFIMLGLHPSDIVNGYELAGVKCQEIFTRTV